MKLCPHILEVDGEACTAAEIAAMTGSSASARTYAYLQHQKEMKLAAQLQGPAAPAAAVAPDQVSSVPVAAPVEVSQTVPAAAPVEVSQTVPAARVGD